MKRMLSVMMLVLVSMTTPRHVHAQQSGRREIMSVPLSVFSTAGDAWVSAKGRWVAVERNTFIISRANAVKIECDRTGGECLEARADLNTPEDGGVKADFDALFASIDHYRVVSFSDRVLIARGDAPAYDFEIRIDLKAKTAQRFAREKGARCATRPDSTCNYSWVLK